MKRQVEGKRVAILATNGFEESELKSPKAALTEAGVKVDVVSLEKGEIRGWSNKDWSGTCPVDKVVADVKAEDYDMLVIPGGLQHQLRNSLIFREGIFIAVCKNIKQMICIVNQH